MPQRGGPLLSLNSKNKKTEIIRVVCVVFLKKRICALTILILMLCSEKERIMCTELTFIYIFCACEEEREVLFPLQITYVIRKMYLTLIF